MWGLERCLLCRIKDLSLYLKYPCEASCDSVLINYRVVESRDRKITRACLLAADLATVQ